MLETPKALGTIELINIYFISDNPKGCNNGLSAGNQQVLNTLVGSSETTRENHIYFFFIW
jgi:hypothetical protein